MSSSAAFTLEQGISHLASIVGQEHVALRDQPSQAIVASPADAQQIAQVLRFADANGLTVMPSGGGTKLAWGNRVASDVELQLNRLDQLREHAWQDMTCTVQAGCSWAAMQAQLQRHGQMVALDPLWPGRATVGGIVACNDSGALRLKYGGLRDLIIGMTIVLADGTIAKSGGKVVKNVAGYDIHKLLTGSLGTLGVIAEVNFRLHPLDEHARTWTATLPDAAQCASFSAPLNALMDSQIAPSSVQVRVSKTVCAVDVRVAGVPECLDQYGARIHRIFAGVELAQSSEEVWVARQSLFEKSEALVLKVSVLPGEVCDISEKLYAWSGDSAAIGIVAQATGLMTVSITAAFETAASLLERLRAHLTQSGGSGVVQQAPDPFKEKIAIWGPDTGTLPLMREIKRRFDPNRILNPGRFVGSI